MTATHNLSSESHANPRELNIDEFSTYALVIDARTPHEYEEDHIPGAANLPVVDDEQFAEVGTMHATDPHSAYLVGAQYASRNVADHIRKRISAYGPDSRFLVYCFRGGKRSRVWADMLRNIGFATDVLKGGWKEYRRWVRASLETLPSRFEWRVLSGLTGCGKTRLLQALADQGNQVLDLEGLASHRGSLIGAVPGSRQPTQKMFDSLLLDSMRRFDPARPVWVEAESKKVGNLQLPDALFNAMRRTVPLQVTAPLQERVRLLQEDYPHFVDDPEAMVEKLSPLKPLIGGEELGRWQSLAKDRQVAALFERVLITHYDPTYARSHKRSYAGSANQDVVVEVYPTNPESLAAAAADLTHRFGAHGAQSRTGTA
jgi:tRNA 2-selenouridine synthase